jgi:hypothetical protein
MEHGKGIAVFTLTIETDNAAFCDESAPDDERDDEEATRQELARILRQIARQLETESPTTRGVYDANGNRVGMWGLD